MSVTLRQGKPRGLIGIAITAGLILSLGVGGPASAKVTPVEDLPEFPALEALFDGNKSATVVQYSVQAGDYRGPSGERVTVQASATYVCKLTVDNPHWSTGARSVITKPRVQCKGPTSTIPMRVYGVLARTTTNSIPSLVVVASSDYIQNVTVTSATNWGPLATWYVPAQTSSQKIARGAYFRGAASASPAPPLVPFSVPGAASAFLWVPQRAASRRLC